MNKQKKFIAERIQRLKPQLRNYSPETDVYYEDVDGDIVKGVVGVAGGETTMLQNGDWCYNWQLVAVTEIPQVAQM